jgi:flagellar hook assembly protein FlgD
VELAIFDLSGKTIKKLLVERKLPGHYQIEWDGANDSGLPVSSGIYFYRLLIDGSYSAMNKIMLIK